MKWILISLLASLVACGQNQKAELETEKEEIPVTSQYFIGDWINMYLVEATTRGDTLLEMTTYTFLENGYYDCSKNITDRWGVNPATKSFFLYYNDGTTYAEFEIDIVSNEEFFLRREYVGNQFIYNFKRTN